LSWALGVAGCAAPAATDAPEPRPRPEIARPLDVYRAAGLLTGPDAFPVVADLATLAGPADSAFLLVGISLPNSTLQFQRDGDAFAARYLVALRVTRDGQPVRSIDRRETVRVADFAETARTDETVVFQTAVVLAPGDYALTLRIRDGLSARGVELEDSVRVPAFAGGRSVADPLPVLRARPRSARDVPPELVMNPRHAIEYGGGGALVYVERYGAGAIQLELRDEAGARVWGGTASPGGGDSAAVDVAGAVVAIPGDSLPLGRLRVTARTDADSSEAVGLVVGLSDEWLAANLDQLLSVLRYVAGTEEVEALRNATPTERRARWERFWEDRDPVPATPVNEFREAFFERVRVASQQFAEPGRPGWLTDRGEVYIVLGRPSRSSAIRSGPEGGATPASSAEEWVYDRVPGGGRLALVFEDRSGLGSWALTRSSAMAFHAVARRVRDTQRR
jgi:GWxTD domain-containing protein